MLSRRLIICLLTTGWLSQCWAYSGGIRICFNETEHSSQCQGTSYTCSGWSYSPAWSDSFRDDTDGRGGGCHYQWRIQAHGAAIDQSMEYRLCFKETEGSSQCQGTRYSCTGWSSSPSWTSGFRDDTDNRGGGCRYAWKIESRYHRSVYHQWNRIDVCRVCFKETEGSSQCQRSRQSCSGWSAPQIKNPAWTLPFRDDTDQRGGGCRYHWYLDCTSYCGAFKCSPNEPCP